MLTVADAHGLIAWFYLGLGALAVGVAFWLGTGWKHKLVYCGLVFAAFAYLPYREISKGYTLKTRYDEARTIFIERCKTAGNKIDRTVEDVEGIMLLKVRNRINSLNDADPMYPGAALYMERKGKDYIMSFLEYERPDPDYPRRRAQLIDVPTELPGYKYVDVISPEDGHRYRYTAELAPELKSARGYVYRLSKQPAVGKLPRYAVTFVDDIDPHLRKHWIAGTTIKVIDTDTDEVIAEQVRYLFDSGLGGTGGFRSPWGWAAHYGSGCPQAQGSLGTQTRFFVDTVLKPIGRIQK